MRSATGRLGRNSKKLCSRGACDGKTKLGTHKVKCPDLFGIGSPGRTRTCDQPVTRPPIFRLGLDYLITRLNIKGRVSGAIEALLDGFRSL